MPVPKQSTQDGKKKVFRFFTDFPAAAVAAKAETTPLEGRLMIVWLSEHISELMLLPRTPTGMKWSPRCHNSARLRWCMPFVCEWKIDWNLVLGKRAYIKGKWFRYDINDDECEASAGRKGDRLEDSSGMRHYGNCCGVWVTPIWMSLILFSIKSRGDFHFNESIDKLPGKLGRWVINVDGIRNQSWC